VSRRILQIFPGWGIGRALLTQNKYIFIQIRIRSSGPRVPAASLSSQRLRGTRFGTPVDQDRSGCTSRLVVWFRTLADRDRASIFNNAQDARESSTCLGSSRDVRPQLDLD
jgi:hypothetical protein